jgi:hypothetical protein
MLASRSPYESNSSIKARRRVSFFPSSPLLELMGQYPISFFRGFLLDSGAFSRKILSVVKHEVLTCV